MRRHCCQPGPSSSSSSTNTTTVTTTSSWATRHHRRCQQRGGATLTAPLRAAGQDRVIAPGSSLLPDAEAAASIASSPAAGPAARRAARQQQQPGRTPAQRERRPNTRHDGNRGGLVNVRVAPPRYRLRQSFDAPRRLHMSPSDPAFEGRLTSEIGACYGPRQLSKIVADFSQHFTPAHAAAAIALLAGMATGREGLQQPEQADTYQAPAAVAAEALAGKLAHATLLDCARAVYGLARLQLHEPQLLAAVEQHSSGQLATATPQALAGLAVGLAHWGHTPCEAWVQELCVASFAAMPGFSAQDLANLMFALSTWRVRVSQPYLLRTLTAFRGHWGSAGCHAPALVRFVFALTQLPACQDLPPAWQQQQPPSASVYVHHEAYRQQRELAAMSAAMGLGATRLQDGQHAHQPDAAASERAAAGSSPGGGGGGGGGGGSAAGGQQQQQQQQQHAGSSSSSSGRDAPQPAAVAAYRLPSFNWLTSFLAECRRQIDRFKPAELSLLLWSCAALNHTPDLIFMDAWCRAASVRMHAFTPAALAAAVQAMGLLQPGRDVPGALSGRWLNLMLQRSQEMMQQQQQQRRHGSSSSSGGGGQAGSQDWQQVPCQAGELSKLLWGLAELRVWPGRAWMRDWLAASEGLLASAAPAELSDTVWALARLRFSPDEAWMSHVTAGITSSLQGFSVQGLAVVIWGYARLGLRPERLWLLRFRAVAAATEGAGGGSGQALASFVAACLAQQNRSRFATGRG